MKKAACFAVLCLQCVPALSGPVVPCSYEGQLVFDTDYCSVYYECNEYMQPEIYNCVAGTVWCSNLTECVFINEWTSEMCGGVSCDGESTCPAGTYGYGMPYCNLCPEADNIYTNAEHTIKARGQGRGASQSVCALPMGVTYYDSVGEFTIVQKCPII